MPVIKTRTIYLEMLAPVEVVVETPRPDAEVSRVSRPCVDFYLRLYREVGASYQWVDRLAMPQQQLQSLIQDDQVDLFVLTVAEQAAGFAELDRRDPGEFELAYFGLCPHVIGQGLGKLLLNWTLQAVWRRRPRRVWLHTCDLDHPAALPNYLKAGFRIYDEVVVDQWIPEQSPR